MLKDCLEIFNKEMKRAKEKTGEEERLILDRYIPADGDYLIVGKNGEILSHNIIKLDKKTGKLEQTPPQELLFYDYHSRLVSMNKPVDSGKTIHSNNYYSFWIKWDSLETGKLNEEAIDRYFDTLKNPEEKYKKPKDRQMYEYIAGQIGEIEEAVLENHRQWIKEHIFSLDKTGMSGKNYLKIFFDAGKENYLNEDKRYLMTKLYNSNDYNIEIENQILGLPNDNLGLNSKKPYLEHKTRKMPVPYLVSPEEALRQKLFFDYLMNFANAGMNDIFFDYDEQKIYAQKRGEIPFKDFSGYFLQIRKAKELEIMHQDVIVDFRCNLKKKLIYRNVLQLEDKEERYRTYQNKGELQDLLHEILFSKYLKQNYFTPQEDIPVDGRLKKTLLWSRGSIFSWIYNGTENGMKHTMHMVCMDMLGNSVQNGYTAKMGQQFNLMCSLDEYFGGENMEETYQTIRTKLREKINSREEAYIESDAEFDYAAGQLVNYFISLSKTNEKKHSLANPFFNITDGKMMKKKLNQYFMKYNYAIDKIKAVRFNRLYSMILHYDMGGKITQEDVIAGYISNNLIYESNKQNDNNTQNNENAEEGK